MRVGTASAASWSWVGMYSAGLPLRGSPGGPNFFGVSVAFSENQ